MIATSVPKLLSRLPSFKEPKTRTLSHATRLRNQLPNRAGGEPPPLRCPSPPLLRLERSPVLCFDGLTAISNVFQLRLGFLFARCLPELAFWPVPLAILTLKLREFNGTEVPNCAELSRWPWLSKRRLSRAGIYGMSSFWNSLICSNEEEHKYKRVSRD